MRFHPSPDPVVLAPSMVPVCPPISGAPSHLLEGSWRSIALSAIVTACLRSSAPTPRISIRLPMSAASPPEEANDHRAEATNRSRRRFLIQEFREPTIARGLEAAPDERAYLALGTTRAVFEGTDGETNNFLADEYAQICSRSRPLPRQSGGPAPPCGVNVRCPQSEPMV